VTASSPQRLVIFINVVGCGTRVPNFLRDVGGATQIPGTPC
jgi:hypothetical protein